MDFGELKKKAITEFFDAWRKIRLYGLEVFDAETYDKIDIGNVVVDTKDSQ
jgi:hypothetical protein